MSERVDLTELIDYMKTVESIYAMSDAVRGELVLALRVLRVLRLTSSNRVDVYESPDGPTHSLYDIEDSPVLRSAERILGIGAASGTAHSATEVKP